MAKRRSDLAAGSRIVGGTTQGGKEDDAKGEMVFALVQTYAP